MLSNYSNGLLSRSLHLRSELLRLGSVRAESELLRLEFSSMNWMKRLLVSAADASHGSEIKMNRSPLIES